MTATHQSTGVILVGATVILLGAAIWSVVAARRSGGRRDHRFAVDRAILVLGAGLVAEGAVGLVIAVADRGPSEPLHLLYGPAAIVTLGLAVALGRRQAAAGRSGGRDWWIVAGAVVLLGIEARLFATG